MKKIIVVKLGRTIATSKRNKIDKYRFEEVAKEVKLLHKHNMHVILVVSAAVTCGEWVLGLSKEYSISKQLVGSVGQAFAIAELVRIFAKHNLKIGQLLLTKQDLEHKQKNQDIKNALLQSIEQDIVLIVNENDMVELNSFGGNDYLATEIAKLIKAERLLLLTDIEHVVDHKMRKIKVYEKHKKLGVVIKKEPMETIGGMQGKIEAAIHAAEQGINTWIANGRTKEVLTRMLLHNEHIGTKVLGGTI